MISELPFILSILALGIVTSYEDIRYGKIRNKHIIAALVLSLLIHTILLYLGAISYTSILLQAKNVLIAIALGFLMWYANWWSAGDAKLLAAYTALVPNAAYEHVAINIVPMTLLTNTLLPIALYLIIIAVKRTDKATVKNALKKTIERKNIIRTLLVVFSLSWVIRETLLLFGIRTNIVYQLIGLYLAAELLKNIAKKHTIKVLIAISILRIAVQNTELISINFLIGFFVILLIYSSVKTFLVELGEIFQKKERIPELQKGMISAENVADNGFKIIGAAPGKIIVKKSEALTQGSIRWMKRKQKEGKLKFNYLKVYETIPFAPFLLIGTLLTLLTKGDAVIFLFSLF